MEKKKFSPFDQLWIGCVAGVIMPIIGLFIFYLYNQDWFHSVHNYFNFIVKSRQYAQMISICAVPNLVAFFGFLQFDFYRSSRGVMFVTLIMAISVVALKAL